MKTSLSKILNICVTVLYITLLLPVIPIIMHVYNLGDYKRDGDNTLILVTGALAAINTGLIWYLILK